MNIRDLTVENLLKVGDNYQYKHVTLFSKADTIWVRGVFGLVFCSILCEFDGWKYEEISGIGKYFVRGKPLYTSMIECKLSNLGLIEKEICWWFLYKHNPGKKCTYFFNPNGYPDKE